MAEITELNDANFAGEIANKDLALVDVYASWCGACRLFLPLFKEAAAQHPEYSWYKADGEKNPEFRAQITGVDNLPFVAVFHRGQFVGGKSLSKREALEEMLAVIAQKVSSS